MEGQVGQFRLSNKFILLTRMEVAKIKMAEVRKMSLMDAPLEK